MITKLDTIQGGVACVGDTRIPVWFLERLRRTGQTDKVLLAKYRALTPDSLQSAWQYVDEHRAEIEEEIRCDGPVSKPKEAE